MENQNLINELINIKQSYDTQHGQCQQLSTEIKALEERRKSSETMLNQTKEDYLKKLQEVATKKKVSILRFAYEVLKEKRKNNIEPIAELYIDSAKCIAIETDIKNDGIFKAKYNPDGRKIHWKYSGEEYSKSRKRELFFKLEKEYKLGKWNAVTLLNVLVKCGLENIELTVPVDLFYPLKNGLCLIDYVEDVKLGFYPNLDGVKAKDLKVCFDLVFGRLPDLYVNLYSNELGDYSISRMWIANKHIEKACVKVLSANFDE